MSLWTMEHGKLKMNPPEKIEEEDVDTQKEMKEVVKESGAKRKKSLPRKRRTVKRQKLEEDAEKEELKGFLDIIPREDVAEDVESLSNKIDQGVGSTVTAIEESKDLSSLALDELIDNLKVHEVVMEKDSKIYRGKKERVKSIALKAKKESSDDETSTSGSDDEEYAMAKGKSNRKCFRCGDSNHLIGDYPKPSRNKDQKAFIGGSWSDNENDAKDKTNDETCLMAQSSNEVCLRTCLEPDEWIKDSGCSKHMTGNKSLFSTYKAYNGEPKNVNEALKDGSWVVAMQEELNQFVANDVWDLVPLPMSLSIIGTKWLFRNKSDENDIVSRNKARFVVEFYHSLEVKRDEEERPYIEFKLGQFTFNNFFGPKKLHIDDIRPDLRGCELFFRENFFCSICMKNKNPSKEKGKRIASPSVISSSSSSSDDNKAPSFLEFYDELSENEELT
ncbi:copia protein [Tanacetum coccineum]